MRDDGVVSLVQLFSRLIIDLKGAAKSVESLIETMSTFCHDVC